MCVCVLGDSSKPRSWSKYANDSSHNKVHKSSESKNSVEKNDVERTKKKSDKEKEKKKIDKKKVDEVKEALEKVRRFFCIVARH